MPRRVREGEGHHLRAWRHLRTGPLVNLWPSERVLITNYPGENPVIEGWSSVVDYGAVLGALEASNFAIQGLTIRNTGVPDAEHGGYGSRSASPPR